VQDEINKRRSKALHLMSVRQVRLERGAVEDVNKTRQELAKPDGVIETTPGMEFEVLKTGDMAAAQFNLLTEAKMEIDAIGANAAVQGKDKTVQSGIALQRRQQAGQTEIGPLMDVLKYWQYRVFKKVWNRIRQYWKEEKWIRVTDDEQNLRWVGLNKPITRGEQMMQQAQEQMQAQGMVPEQMQQMMQQMMQQVQQDPLMKEVVSTENDIAELDVDIILTEVPDALTAQIEDFQVLGEMVKSGFQMPPLAVIEASPLSNKDKIIKMMKEGQQIPPEVQKQVDGMKEQLQKLAEENQTLKSGQQDTQAKIAARQQEQAAELDLKTQVQSAELKLLKEKTDAEIELKRLTANADYEIEQRKMEMTQECEMRKINMTQEHETKKMDFENKMKQDAMLPDDVRNAMHMNKVAETDVMPKVVEAISGEFAAMQAVLEAILQAIQNPPPRQVNIGNVMRGRDGKITGANLSSTTVQ